jgi:hypothetical protein
MAFAAFDVLELDGYRVMGEPWTARRKRLQDLLEAPPPHVCLVAVADDAAAVWDTWVGMGGEGIVPQGTDLAPPSQRPLAGVAQAEAEAHARGGRDGGSSDRITWGDWGEAVMLVRVPGPLLAYGGARGPSMFRAASEPLRCDAAA